MSQNPFDALGGGGFDMNALLQQAQQMQEQLAAAQQRLHDTEVEGSVGGVLPALAVLTLMVPDPATTAAVLDRHDVAYRQASNGAIGIPAAYSHGVMLEFAAG